MGQGKFEQKLTWSAIIHLIRHSEAEHKPHGGDRSYRRRDLFDPKLTKDGMIWCDEWHEIFLKGHAPNVTHILTSPMWRCIETACRLYRDTIRSGVRVIALSELQNWDQGPNGTGSSLRTLKRVFGDADRTGYGWELEPLGERGRIYRGCVDFTHLKEDWNVPTNKKVDHLAVREQMKFVYGFLDDLNKKHMQEYGRPAEIAIISHGSALRKITDPYDYWEDYEYECKKTLFLHGKMLHKALREKEVEVIRKKQNARAFKCPSIMKKVIAYTDSRCNPRCGGGEEDFFVQNEFPPHEIRQQFFVSELRRQLWSLQGDRKENDREHDYLDDRDGSDIEDENKATIPPLFLDYVEDPMHVRREMEESRVFC